MGYLRQFDKLAIAALTQPTHRMLIRHFCRSHAAKRGEDEQQNEINKYIDRCIYGSSLFGALD